MSRLSLVLLVLTAACTQVPELNEQIRPDLQSKSFPRLIPLDETLGPAVIAEDEARKLEQSLASRRAALEARARRLRQPVLDEAERTRLNESVTE
ncbi:hypothetical protein [Ruegeria marina]|uniref:Uncharacterized protein n=1 Tax=Ruegeria marina TaxID=639004 RepID=A0A1G6XAN6_9RHOB|nr:hypothetical protein [Ruegeria marina]SDD75260.1 hypothetical protein SAMN04488239_11028 [Ruegeria marina]